MLNLARTLAGFAVPYFQVWSCCWPVICKFAADNVLDSRLGSRKAELHRPLVARLRASPNIITL
jgi:hypothetical protein